MAKAARPPKANPICELAGQPSSPTDPRTAAVLLASVAGQAPLCPYKVFGEGEEAAFCTKSSVTNPIPVCSIYNHRGGGHAVAITCPSRFLEGGVIFERMERDLLPSAPAGGRKMWLPEVRLPMKGGEEDIGRIDYVGVTLDSEDTVLAAVNVELQAVYSSGSSRKAFNLLRSVANSADDTGTLIHEDWNSLRSDYPTTDFLSSWKRIKYQIVEKGAGIMSTSALWPEHRFPIRQALVVDTWFFGRILKKAEGVLTPVDPKDSDYTLYSCALSKGADGLRKLVVEEPPFFTTYEDLQKFIGGTQAADLLQFLENIEIGIASRRKKSNRATPEILPTAE